MNIANHNDSGPVDHRSQVGREFNDSIETKLLAYIIWHLLGSRHSPICRTHCLELG
jgi:hypothetical protein